MIGEEDVRAILLPFVLHVPEAYEAARAAMSAHLTALERAGLVVVPKATRARDMQRAATKRWLEERMAPPPPQNSDEVKP